LRGPSTAVACLFAAALPCAVTCHAQQTTQQIEIIGTSPLPGQGVSRDALPYNTQVVRRGAIDAAQSDNATDFMARRMAGVQVNDIQGSPFQGDLTFRGFRASGILGASQGLSVYLDGVRVNEPFGDVVNWDLIPEFAIDSMSLVPGANPAFGLNSLGGALSFTTASGRNAPGVRSEASLGSFSRKRVSVSHGAQHGSGLSHYVGIGLFDENGWRDFSKGHLGNVVGKLAHSSDAGEFGLNLLAGRSSLVGNGLAPMFTYDDGQRTPDFGQARREAVYTHPDKTDNRVTQASLQWRRAMSDNATLEALAYVRHSRRETINGDEADLDETPELDVATLQSARARRQAFAPDGAPVNAAFNRTATRQRATGAALAWSQTLGAHQWQAGASVDAARVTYEQTEREGSFDATRGVLPFADADDELSARVEGRTRSLGLYVTDTWRIAPRTHVTGTLRVNHARVANTLTSVDDDTGDVQQRPRETFSYRSANPALGVAHRVFDGGPTLFANVARNNRVPTVIELGCADPDEPCRLPAGLQADPFLEQVKSTTVETGLRAGGGPGQPWRAALALFRTDNRNDILFRSVSVVGQLGYFQNFARTRHQGVDAELSTKLGAFDLGLAYSHLDATYQADGTLRMGDRNVAVTRGSRIAGLPRHLLKASVDWSAAAGLSLGADVQALSRRGVAGNEDGLIENGGVQRFDFSLPGYALLNLRASWKPVIVKGLELFARITNVTNRRYASFGAIAETVFDANGTYTGEASDALFAAPGAPRAFTLGARWNF
jgi:outer membrane receptor protein involved in Fe transport